MRQYLLQSYSTQKGFLLQSYVWGRRPRRYGRGRVEKEKKDSGQEVLDGAVIEEELSGLSEEGSIYDSEDDKKALKEAKKKRKAVAQTESSSSKKKRISKKKWAVCPESVANIGGPDSMLGKSMSR